jgi:hypothetical protein
MDATIDALAFLYITFAHSTDGSLTGEEMRTLATRLHGWRPSASLDELGAAMKRAVDRYKSQPDMAARRAEADRCAEALAKGSVEDKQRILADLRGIAEVDGKITPDESAFIDSLRERLG